MKENVTIEVTCESYVELSGPDVRYYVDVTLVKKNTSSHKAFSKMKKK